MTELIKQYVEACEKAQQTVSSQLLQQLEIQLKLNIQEQYYPSGSLQSELDLYNRILLEKENEDRATKIIKLLTDYQVLIASPLRQIVDTTILEKAGCLRINQIKQTLQQEIIISVTPILKVLPQKLHQVNIDDFVNLFSQVILRQNILTPRIRALQTASLAASGIFKLFNEEFIIKQNILFLDEFETEIKQIGHQMSHFEEKAAEKLLSNAINLNKDNFFAIFGVLATSKGLLKRPRVKKVFNELENTIKDIFMNLKFQTLENDYIQIFQQVKDYKTNYKAAFSSIGILFSDKEWFKEAQQVAKNLENSKDLDNFLLKITQQAQLDIVKYLEEFKPQPLFFFDSHTGKAVATFSSNIQKVFDIVVAFQQNSQKLTLNGKEAQIKMLFNCFGANQIFGNVAGFYNTVNSQLQPFQIAILRPSISAFENEMKKAAGGSVFSFDDANVEKIKKAAVYIENIMKQFQTRIDKLEEFRKKFMREIKIISSLDIDQSQLWIDSINSLKLIITQLIDSLPPEQAKSAYNFAAGAVGQITAIKYTKYLENQINNIPTIKLASTLEFSFDLSQNQIKQQIIDHFSRCVNIITPQYFLFESELFTQIQSLSVNILVQAFAIAEQKASSVYEIMQYFKNKYYGISWLYQQKSDQLAAAFIKTPEQVQLLFDQGCELDQSPNDELYYNFKEVIVVNEYKSLYKLDIFEFDLTILMNQLNDLQMAYQTVAISAASYISSQSAQRLVDEVSIYSQKMQQSLQGIQTSEQLADLRDYFQKSKELVFGQLNQQAKDMLEFYKIIQMQSTQRDSVLKLIELSSYSYNVLKEKMEGTESILEDKKQEMKSVFTQEIQDIIATCTTCKSDVLTTLQTLAAIFTQLTKVSSTITTDNTLFHLHNNPSPVTPLTEIFTTTQEKIAQISAKTTTIDKEFKLLFNDSYKKNLTTQENDLITETLSLNLPITTLHQLLIHSNNLLTSIQSLLQLDWPTLKTRMDLLDEISSNAVLIRENVSKFNELSQDEINSFCAALEKFCEFVVSFAQILTQNLKILKSPVLTRQHWLEIIENSDFLKFIKHYSVNSQFASQIPDSISGVSFCHFFAVLGLNSASQEFSVSGNYDKFLVMVREILVRAENEQSIRGAVEEVQFWLTSEAKIEFSFIELSKFSQQELEEIGAISKLPGSGTWKPILTALTEKKSVLASVASSIYSKFLTGSISDSNCAIEAIVQFALLQGQIGRQITVLEPVISRKVLIKQNKKFYQALKIIAFIFQEQNSTQYISSLIRTQIPEQFLLPVISPFDHLNNYKQVIQQLEAANNQLSQVQLALRVFLEQKRLLFPRFYFLADSDVLELLSGAFQNPEIVNLHIKKMFSAIEKIEIQDQLIESFISSEGEKVMLNNKIQITDSCETWLGQLDLQIKQTLKNEFLKILLLSDQVKEKEGICTKNSEVKQITPFQLKNDVFFCIREIQNSIKANLDIQNCSGEMLCIAFSVMFTAQVDYAIFGQKDETKLLEQTKSRMLTFLKAFTDKLYSPQLCQSTFGSQEYVLSLKLKLLATDTTHFISVLDDLLAHPDNRTWIWNRELKYRVFQNTGDLYLVALDTFLPYTFEYQGLPPRLIHTPLTDRCFSTLTAALNCSKSSNPQGPAGTGKTETVKAFCAKLARPCIVFNCDSAIDRDNLSRILIGIVLSGSVGCFDEVNRLSPAVLSAVSTDIEDVQKAIFQRSQNQNLDNIFTLSDISVPLSKISPFSGVFVTMNPASREYRGRSELPFSLIKLLRPCFMGKADTSQIMETILSTSGFQFAKIWALKVDLTYSLASRRIPKQVHLDWGLRSLQAVLRQAALQRASLKPANDILAQERAVIIKSLSDATFSRVQGISKQIFTEILFDIFGKNDSEEKKFGASSEIEERLAEKINATPREGELVMQLFRALTAKTGVALLGKTASGKTQIRQKMKEAVYQVSNGFIEVREFLISPKSMSRSELLGYVDSVTKEWVDGALTRAARQAVNLLQNKQKPYIWPLIVFDGEIDPAWIEALNSSLDDNRLLSLSSGERIRFPMSLNPLEAYFSNASLKKENGAEMGTNLRMDYQIPTPVSFLFETDSVIHASPATISRLAVILVSDPDFEEQFDTVKQINEKLANLTKMIPQTLIENLPIITTHINNAGLGEEHQQGKYAYGALRALHNFHEFSEGDMVKFSDVLGGGKDLSQQCISPSSIKDNSIVKQHIWAQKLIMSYLENNTCVCLYGGKQTGKYYCLQKAIQEKNYQILEIACTQLTSRDDVIRSLTQTCIEFQRSDGIRIIKPKSDQKLIVMIRDADVVKCDEYGHSEIYSLLWSIVSHNKIYLKNGHDCLLQDIIVNISVTNYDTVPKRIQRLIGLVKFEDLTEIDYKVILQDFYQQYLPLSKQTNLKMWLNQAVDEAENLLTRAQQQNQNYFIALPNLLPQFKQLQLSQLIQLKKSDFSLQQIISILEYLVICPVPYKKGREMAQKDLECLGQKNQDQYLTYFNNNIIQSIQRAISLDDPIKVKLNPEFVGYTKKLQQIKELIQVSMDYYPFLLNCQQIFEKLSQHSIQYILDNISAIELSLIQTQGVIVYSLPNNLSLESIYISLLTTGHDIRFIGSDSISNQTIKSIAERVAHGFTKLAIILDSSTLEIDSQWIQLVSAVSSKDTGYFRNKLNLADLRSLISLYQEKLAITEDLTEEQLINQFLSFLINSIVPVLLLNPERKLTNMLLEITPPLRRAYNIVSFELQENSTLSPFINAQFITIQPEYKLTLEKEFQSYFQEFIKQFSFSNVLINNSQFIRAFIIYNQLQYTWQEGIQSRRNQLLSGLKQLDNAQTEVDKLSSEAEKRQKAVVNAQTLANTALADITKKMVIVQENKRLADQMKSELAVKEVEITKQKYESEQELSTVMPILEEATKAVSSIPNDAVSEVKSFKNPPPAVAIVLEAVLTFMGQADMSWQGMRAFLSQSGVLRQIASLDIKKVPSQQLKKVMVLTQKQPDAFEQEKIQRVSRAAAPLAKWVTASLQYASVYVKIEPLIKQAQQAADALIDLKNNLNQTEISINNLEIETKALRENFDQKTQDLIKYQAELEQINIKKQRGDTMLNSLKDERIRWKLNEVETKTQIEGLHKASVQAAVMFILAGNKTDDIRSSFIGEESRIFMQNLLIDVTFRDQAKHNGLRDSNQAMENAKLIHQMKEQKGILGFIMSNVTDSTGALAWLQKEFSSQQVSATSENLSNLLAIAARFGQHIIVTDCDNGSLPSALIAYLRYGSESYKKSENSSNNQENDSFNYNMLMPQTTLLVPSTSAKFTELHPNFKVFVVSSVSIQVPSDLQSKILEVSFAPTEKSRSEYYIDQVLKSWSPESLSEIQKLNETEAELRFNLTKIELSLLEALQASEKSTNILEDENLMQVLVEANQKSAEVKKTREQANKIKEKLDSMKQKAMIIADVVGKSVFALEQINQLNELYVVDDSTVVPILNDILTKHQNPNFSIEIINKVIRTYLSDLYVRLNNMVFSVDKIGAVSIMLRYCSDIFTPQLFKFFTGRYDSPLQQQIPEWAKCNPQQYSQLVSAMGDKLQGLKFEHDGWSQFNTQIQEWKEIALTKLPSLTKELSILQKLAIVTFLRSDLLSQCLSLACEETFLIKNASVQDPVQQALKLVNGIYQPIIIYTASGQDPTNTLNSQILAISPGKEQEADQNLFQFLDQAGKQVENKIETLIVIKGAHLCLSWLNQLSSKLIEYSNTFSAKYDPSYPQYIKILLLLEPKANFPKNLSRISWRIHLQSQSTPKDTFLQLVYQWPKLDKKSLLTTQFYSLLYILTSFHSIIEGRRLYAPRGVANDPGWNSQDLISLIEILLKMYQFDVKIELIIERIRGLIVDAIYGVSTKDSADLNLINSMLNVIFNKQMINYIIENEQQELYTNLEELTKFIGTKFPQSMNNFPFLKYVFPPLGIIQKAKSVPEQIAKFVNNNFPQNPSPDSLALPGNALFTKGEKDSLRVKSILQRDVENNSNSTFYQLSIKYSNMFQIIYQKLNALKYSEVKNPIFEELDSQFNIIIKQSKVIKQELEEILFASQNPLMASQKSRQIAQYINQGITPEHWTNNILAPPTPVAPLDSPSLVTISTGSPEEFFKFLESSGVGISNSIINMQKRIEIELNILPRPTAIMEAIRRYFGVQKGKELDQISLKAVINGTQGIIIKNGSFMLQGCGYSQNQLDLKQNCGIFNGISIEEGKIETGVPIYVDKGREIKMEGTEFIFVDGKENEVEINGVYLHLTGR